MSAATAAAAACASRRRFSSEGFGSNNASNNSTSERAVPALSLTTVSMWDWLYGKPACRRYFAYIRSTTTCCQVRPARNTSSLNRSTSTRPCQIAVTASANRCAMAARSGPAGGVGTLRYGETLNWYIQTGSPSARVTVNGRSSSTTTPMDCSIGSSWLSDADRPPRYQMSCATPSAPRSPSTSLTELSCSSSMIAMSLIASSGATACLYTSGNAAA